MCALSLHMGCRSFSRCLATSPFLLSFDRLLTRLLAGGVFPGLGGFGLLLGPLRKLQRLGTFCQQLRLCLPALSWAPCFGLNFLFAMTFLEMGWGEKRGEL